MMEQVLGITAIAIVAIWGIAMIVAQILYLIASFRSSVGLTILSMFVPFLGLYVLVKFWEDLKKPFLNQLVVAFGGFALIFLGGMGLNAMGVGTGLAGSALPETVTATSPERPPAIQEIKTIQPRPAVQPVKPPEPATPAPSATPPNPAPTGSAQTVQVPILNTASITVPQGWLRMPWKLPNLAVAMGDAERGEFVTVQSFDNAADLSFEEFQGGAISVVLEHLIESTPPTESQHQRISDCDVATFGMGGLSRLPDQPGQTMSARVSCVNGHLRRYIIVQWRTGAWDTQTVQTFSRLLTSFTERKGE